jgi:uncharacterized membrane protein YebE (DUF533 family)
MNEQKINVCRTLASVFASKNEVSDAEAAFVGRTALDLGLDEGELKLVQQSLATALDTSALLKTISDPALRRFLLRRVVAATLIDAELTEKERQVIDSITDTFGWDKAVVGTYVEHMQAFIEMEKKGEELLARLG